MKRSFASLGGNLVAKAIDKDRTRTIEQRLLQWVQEAFSLLVESNMADKPTAEAIAMKLAEEVCLPLGDQDWPTPEQAVLRLQELAKAQALQAPAPPSVQ